MDSEELHQPVLLLVVEGGSPDLGDCARGTAHKVAHKFDTVTSSGSVTKDQLLKNFPFGNLWRRED